MEKRFKQIFLVSSLLVVVILVAVVIDNTSKVETGVKPNKNYASVASPTPIPFELKSEVLSPDAKLSLIVQNKLQTNKEVKQTFSVVDRENKTTNQVYETTSISPALVTIPANTFSPNKKFFFLKAKDSSSTKYIVFRTDGKDISKENQSVEIADLFTQKHPDFQITDVTGWGGYSLLVVNTDTPDSKTGPSWWFDLSNFSFIRLSTRFN